MPFIIPALAAIGGGSALAGGALVAGTGAALYGASQQSGAIKDAAGAQEAASQAAIAEQRRQFDITQSNLAPWLGAGKSALNQQLQLLGLGGLSGAGGSGGPQVGGYNTQKLLSDNPDIAAWVQAGHGDPSATGQQTPDQAVNYWIQNGIAQGDPRAINAPRYTADDVTAGGANAQQQQAIDQLKGGALYQSLYRNGQDTILANGSATGGLRGGNIQRSLANFGSDTLATVIQQQLANLGGISNTGNSTGTNLGQLGAASSGNISQLLQGQGQAQAGGILGSSQASLGGLSSLLSGLGQGIGNIRGLPGPAMPNTPQYTGVQPFDPINGLF